MFHSDNFEVRHAMRHCKEVDTARFTTFECIDEPTYVLSRKCTSQYYGGPGPCCKVDEIMSFIAMDKPNLYAHTKYAVHCDDDTYFRVDQMLRYLALIENSGVNALPIILNFERSLDATNPAPHVYGLKSGT